MVVWLKPCKSRSTLSIYYRAPLEKSGGAFLWLPRAPHASCHGTTVPPRCGANSSVGSGFSRDALRGLHREHQKASRLKPLPTIDDACPGLAAYCTHRCCLLLPRGPHGELQQVNAEHLLPSPAGEIWRRFLAMDGMVSCNAGAVAGNAADCAATRAAAGSDGVARVLSQNLGSAAMWRKSFCGKRLQPRCLF